MSNKYYQKGIKKEYKICNKLKEEGFNLVQRTCGSHSPVDIIAVKFSENKIYFIQSKPNSMTETAKERLKLENKKLNGLFMCSFEVV